MTHGGYGARIVIGLPGHSYLRDHVLDGTPVLPFAIASDMLASAAMEQAGGGVFRGLDDIRVLQGVTLKTGPVELLGWTSVLDRGEDGRVAAELRGAADRVHYRAVVRLGEPWEERPPAPAPLRAAGSDFDPYDSGLFHGPMFRCIQEVQAWDESGIDVRLEPAPAPGAWISEGAPSSWTIDPLLVDGVFQALILWSREHAGGPCLPSRVASLSWYGAPTGSVTARIRVRRRAGGNLLSDADLVAEDGRLVARLEGVTCTVARSLDRAFQDRAVRPAAS